MSRAELKRRGLLNEDGTLSRVVTDPVVPAIAGPDDGFE